MQSLVLFGLQTSRTSPRWLYGSRLRWSVAAGLQDTHQLTTATPWKHKAPLPRPAPADAPIAPPSERYQIILPETRKGKIAMQRAASFWKEHMTAHGHGNIQTSAPLKLEIDFEPSVEATEINPDGILFARDHPLGLELWRIANPITWSKRSRVFKSLVYGLMIYYGVLFVLWISNQEEEPITGRRRFNWISHAKSSELKEQERLEHDAYWGQLQKYIVPRGDPVYQALRSVFARLIAAAGVDDINWEIFVVNAPTTVNATVHSTGQVIVYSGLLDALNGDDELAAVLSHEISHVIAQHNMETRSGTSLGRWILAPFFPIFVGAFFGVLELAVVAIPPASVAAAIFMYLSRNQEKEADYIGMLLMSEAGFDPNAAVSVWRKMEKVREAQMQADPKLKAPVGFLSPHPHDAARIQQNSEWVPEALHITGRASDIAIEPTSTLSEKKRKWQKILNGRHQPALAAG